MNSTTARTAARAVARLKARMAATRTIMLRVDDFKAAVEQAGFPSTYALAAAMGLHPATVGRVQVGAIQPGPAFIGGALHVLTSCQFTDLFEVVAANPLLEQDDDPLSAVPPHHQYAQITQQQGGNTA